jgi:hypothetical protein
MVEAELPAAGRVVLKGQSLFSKKDFGAPGFSLMQSWNLFRQKVIKTTAVNR